MFAGKGTWSVGRVPEAEAALTTAGTLTPHALLAALEALIKHVTGAGADAYTVQCAEGLLFSALAPHVDQVGCAKPVFCYLCVQRSTPVLLLLSYVVSNACPSAAVLRGDATHKSICGAQKSLCCIIRGPQ